MSEENEQRIISRIILDGEIQQVLDRGVDRDWFLSSEHRDALEFVLDHYSRYGTIPSKTALKSHVGASYALPAVSDTMEYLLDQQVRKLRWIHLRAVAEDVGDLLNKGDVDDALARVESGLASVHAFAPTTSRMVDSMEPDRLDERWDAYEEREKGGAIIGFTTGFPTIDATTLGLQPGHLVTIIAPPKVGKTSLSLAVSNHVFKEHGQKILFASFEMGIAELEMRQEALMGGLDFRKLQSGTLTPLEKKKYGDLLDEFEAYKRSFWFMDAASGSTVSALSSQIEKIDPGAVFLDGIYMLTDEVTGEVNTAQALTNITRSLKRLATQIKKPIVINTQALEWKMKGNRLSLNSTGYSSSFAQDSDVVLGLERMEPKKGETEESYAFQRILRILASRNSGLNSVELIFDYTEGKIEEATE